MIIYFNDKVEGMEKNQLCSVMARAIQGIEILPCAQQCKQTTWLGTKGTGVS